MSAESLNGKYTGMTSSLILHLLPLFCSTLNVWIRIHKTPEYGSTKLCLLLLFLTLVIHYICYSFSLAIPSHMIIPTPIVIRLHC